MVKVLVFILLAFIVPNFLIAQTDRVIDIGTLGIKPGEDATPYLFRIFKSADKGQGLKIVFPNGRYDFFPDKAFEKYLNISNNNSGLRRTAFPIIGFKNIEIEGQGSTFIFHGRMIPFVIENSENIHLKNFNVDFAEPLHFEGTVIANDTVSKTFDLQVLKDCKYEIRNGKLVYKGYNWELGFKWNIFFDSKTKRPIYNTGIYSLPEGDKKVTAVSDGVIRLYNEKSIIPPIGAILVDWTGRDVPGFRVFNSKNLNVENVNLYHCLGMGMIIERTINVSLDKFNVVLPPNSDRIVTATADATHFVNCKGKISVTNSVFENMLDDACNIHGVYEDVVDYMDDTTIGIRLNHVEQNGFTFAEAGDSVRFINRNTMMPILSAKVTGMEVVNEKYTIVRIDKKVKGILSGPVAIENTSWTIDSAVIKNCIVRQNRARAILIQTTGNVLIENNYFQPQMDGIIIGGESNYWFESGPVNQVVIRKNTFENYGLQGISYALTISPSIKKEFREAGFYHRNVIFEDNSIKTFDTPVVYAMSVNGLVIRNNRITKTDTYKQLSKNKAQYKIEYSKNVTIKNNKNTDGSKSTVEIENCNPATVKVSK